jgi:hypothetical protein
MLIKAKETIWLEGAPPHNWRKIAISPTTREAGVVSKIAWFRQLIFDK